MHPSHCHDSDRVVVSPPRSPRRAAHKKPWIGGSTLCALEEALLPTFVAQRYASPEWLARASPPLVVRVYTAVTIDVKAHWTRQWLQPRNLLEMASCMVATDSQFSRGLAHVFGWKVPRMSPRALARHLRLLTPAVGPGGTEQHNSAAAARRGTDASDTDTDSTANTCLSTHAHAIARP